MLASQLIYTACGKNKTGAFDTWSKSPDITVTEEKEIQSKMLYKRPVDLPPEPTQEELDTLFPKKFGYFYLTSGRVCMAQATYIGAVYSDLDKRTGNYIIHAFVFDKTDALIPMNFIGSTLFRQNLGYEEWHEGEAPASLPRVEITEKPAALTKQDVDAFFDGDRTKRLEQLLQAIMNAAGTDAKVTFYDVHTNLPYWYKAISLCLPKSMQSSLTFNTFFTPSAGLPTQAQSGAINTEIKIRNVSPGVPSSVFSYQQEARAGKYAFNFEGNVLPAPLALSKYVETVVKMLGTNIFNAIMLVDAVEKIGNTCGADPDLALEIYCLLNKKFAGIDESRKLSALLGYAQKYYADKLPEIADGLYQHGIASNAWRLAREWADIYRFIFEYSDVADKGLMIHKYAANQEAFGVDTAASSESYCRSFRQCAPFEWVNFLDYLFDGDNLTRYFKECGDGVNSRYLVFDTFVDAMPEIANDPTQKQIAMNYLVDSAKLYIQKEMLNELLALVKCIAKCGPKWQSFLIKKAYAALAAEHKASCRPEFTLGLAEAAGDAELGLVLVSTVIAENMKNKDFVKCFVEHYDRSPSFYAGIFGELKKDSAFAPFAEGVELYRFANASHVSKNDLRDYYDKYVATGKDSGVFLQKIRQLLSAARGAECINESIDCYRTWIAGGILSGSMRKEVAKAALDCFFAASPEAFRDYIAKRGTVQLEEMLAELPESEYRVPATHQAIAFGEELKKLVAEIKAQRRSPAIERTKEKLAEERFYELPPRDERAKELFVREYTEDVLYLYLLLAEEKDFDEVLTQLLKPLCGCANFDASFADAAKRLNERQYDQLLSDLIVCACGRSSKFTDYLMSLVRRMLDEVGRGKRKKLFADLLAHVPKEYEKKTRAFVDEYQKEHESFFGKIFGGFGGKNEEEKEDPKGKDKRKWKR